jgi:hypothetical protein
MPAVHAAVQHRWRLARRFVPCPRSASRAEANEQSALHGADPPVSVDPPGLNRADQGLTARMHMHVLDGDGLNEGGIFRSCTGMMSLVVFPCRPLSRSIKSGAPRSRISRAGKGDTVSSSKVTGRSGVDLEPRTPPSTGVRAQAKSFIDRTVFIDGRITLC